MSSTLPLVVLRVALSALGYGVFRVLDWSWARVRLRDLLASVLSSLGDRVETSGMDLLRVNREAFQITADCTYLELSLLLLPFLWFRGASFRSNLARALGVVAAIQVVNLGRVLLAIHLHANCGDWFTVHDLPDYLIYWPMFAAVIGLSARRDQAVEAAGQGMSGARGGS
ncbi:MAG: hypothetical protein HY721_17190 [Planctomycetes bacterium]|nr:hypothetical protein [Planctomycetota bacterium]